MLETSDHASETDYVVTPCELSEIVGTLRTRSTDTSRHFGFLVSVSVSDGAVKHSPEDFPCRMRA